MQKDLARLRARLRALRQGDRLARDLAFQLDSGDSGCMLSCRGGQPAGARAFLPRRRAVARRRDARINK
jgi:hypothetical protein